MKVLMINGSPHKDGNTALALREIASQLEKQGDINSENIKTAKANIEGIMDKLVEGFDTQLDKLFKSDAIDITNDVKVLEKMMQMDRLNK